MLRCYNIYDFAWWLTGSMLLGAVLSGEAFAFCLDAASVGALRSIGDQESFLRRLWAAIAVFAERTTPSDGALRRVLMWNVAALHDAAGMALGGPGKRAAAALTDAGAVLTSQSQQQMAVCSASAAARSRLLTLLGISEEQVALLPADLTVSDALGTQLAAAGADGLTDDQREPSAAAIAWSEAICAGELVRVARSAAYFAALLQAVQQDAAAAVEARRESALQLGFWRYSRPQVCMLPCLEATPSPASDRFQNLGAKCLHERLSDQLVLP
jgi:hypothetical protein